MKERPILFSAPMVKAILEDRKTQTRRVLNPQPSGGVQYHPCAPHCAINGNGDRLLCKFGKHGDRLWVRETHFINHFLGSKCPEAERDDVEIFYRATDDKFIRSSEDTEGLAWKPSIHMPRWASRITLEITGVRVERLQDISEADAIAEGGQWTDNGPRHWAKPGATFEELNPVNGWNEGWSHIGQTDQDKCLSSAIMSYANLWESINGTGSWDHNPWVWVLEFKRVEQ
jgi:hypothetical protein